MKRFRGRKAEPAGALLALQLDQLAQAMRTSAEPPELLADVLGVIAATAAADGQTGVADRARRVIEAVRGYPAGWLAQEHRSGSLLRKVVEMQVEASGAPDAPWPEGPRAA